MEKVVLVEAQPIHRHILLLELMLIPLPGDISLAVIPEAGALLAETGALLIVEVGISHEMSGPACTDPKAQAHQTPATKVVDSQPADLGAFSIKWLDSARATVACHKIGQATN